jgi:hypothetical protein
MNYHFGLEFFFAQQASRFEARNAKEKGHKLYFKTENRVFCHRR